MRRILVFLLVIALGVALFVLTRAPPQREPRAPPGSPVYAPAPGARAGGAAGVAKPPPEKKSKQPDPRFVAVPKNPDATLDVVVTDSTGRACAGAVVYAGVVVDGAGKSGPEAAAGADGRVTLEVEADTVRSVTARVGSLSRWLPVRLAKGSRRVVRILMPAGGKILGELRHPRSGPLAGVTLATSLRAGGRTDFLRAETDAAGRFVFGPVPAGVFKITIHARPGGHTLNDYVTVRHDGAETIDVGVVFVGGAVLQGTVRDAADASPLPGVKVSLHDPVRATTTTRANGAYIFSGLTASAYDLSFRKPGYGPRYLRDVVVRAEKPETLDVTLVRGAVLDVFVRDTGGQPVAGPVRLGFSRTGSSTSSSGRLELDDTGRGRYEGLLPGSYRLDVSRTDLECVPVVVDVAPGANTVRFTVKRRTRRWGKGVRSLYGTVRDAATGRPLPGVRIDGPRGEAYTGARGEYVLHDLGAGKHRLFLTKEGYGDLRATGVVPEDGAEQEKDLTLEPAATLRLNLRDAEGRPVAGEVELIYVRRVGGEKVGGGGRPRADEQGRAVFRRLLPGRHRLILSVPGIGAAEVDTTIEPGENVLDIVLKE